MKNTLLISTRKGLIVAKMKEASWKIVESHFDSIPVTFSYEDPRNGYWWVALDHGHWGIKLHLSKDKGKSWKAKKTPAYPTGTEIKEGVKAFTTYIWSIHHGGFENPHRMLIGTIPGGLFESDDYGETWNLNQSLWNHESRINHWFGGGFDHPGIHSINLDPRNEDYIQIGISCAGVFESSDRGMTWKAKNEGLIAEFLPDHHAEYGHDPHLLVRSESNPEVLWQQNHCGIFKSIDNGAEWLKVSEEKGPAHFGFAMAVSSLDENKAWVAPAVSDEDRIAIDKKLQICRTSDGGKSWTSLTNGLPGEFTYDIVYRHALVADKHNVVFGTTTGNLFHSNNEGDDWYTLSNYLPMIHAIHFASS